MIVYRLCPARHVLMYRLFLGTSIAEITSTAFESIVVLWLFGTLWQQWTLSFKVVTPILHSLFSTAQLFGAWILWQLAKKEKAAISAAERDLSLRSQPEPKGILDESPMKHTTTDTPRRRQVIRA